MAADLDLHPDVEPLAWLLGTWQGEGEGWYPTIADFRYREEATWSHVGKPFLVYSQSTWAVTDGRPLHGERGFLRSAGGQLELVVAHSGGLVEVAVGAIDDVLVLSSTTIVATPTAKEVRSVDRRLWRSGPSLCYELGMAAVGQTHQGHLRATLIKT